MQSETPSGLPWRWIYKGFWVVVIAEKCFLSKLFFLKSTGPETMFNRLGSKSPVQRTSQSAKRTSGARVMACPRCLRGTLLFIIHIIETLLLLLFIINIY